MAQVTITQRLDLVQETAREIIKHQKGQVRTEVTDFLDSVAEKLLCDNVFRKQDWVRDSGLFGVLFPQEYGVHVRDKERKSNAPYMQQVECIVRGSEETKIKFEFHFLQPKLRMLKEWIDSGNGKGSWNIWCKVLEVDGKTYTRTVENVVPRIIDGKLAIGDLLKVPHIIQISYEDKDTNTEILDEKGNLKGRYTYQVPKIAGLAQISVTKCGMEGHYKVTFRVTNTSTAKSQEAREFIEEQVAKKCFYGTFAKISAEGGTIISPRNSPSTNVSGYDAQVEKEVLKCANVNTSPLISKAENNLLFASPIILYDFPRHEPVKMSKALSELCSSEETLLENLDELDESEKNFLVRSGKIADLQKIVLALSKTNPDKIKELYKFQWVGIQKFLKQLIQGNNIPVMIGAPTDSGKSIIFYVCSVLMKIFNHQASGTLTFITFPTRALNQQQFAEMVYFYYQLNKQGIAITLGLYMGSEFDDRDTAVKTYWPPDVKAGQDMPDIERCPACLKGSMVAHKPDERRVIPKCNECGEELNFIFLSNMESESFCPNVIIGTPDKIVYALTNSPFSHTIFGAPCKKCPNCKRYHLLLWSNQNDAVHKCKYCNIDLGPQTRTQSSPQFIVFDEIHTLSGTQGNLLGQFLSLMKVVNKKYGLSDKYWYLGATATIANQQELVQHLTGHSQQVEFPTKAEFGQYFKKRMDNIRHRYLVLEPLGRTTRWSVSTVTLDIYSILKEVNRSDNELAKKLGMKYPIANAYKTQTIYVLRKTDGRNLEKYIPDLASTNSLPTPYTQFGSGDLPRSELVKLNKKVRDLKLDVLVVTQIYGQGVDFPGLNIIHFFGIPRSFIELAQVVGRTGRREEIPGLVLLHLQSEIPRDQWVYKHFRDLIEYMEELYEPIPINVMNRFAVSLSFPNVLNSLLIAQTAKDYRLRFADYSSKYFLNDARNLGGLLGEIREVYLKEWLDDAKEEERLKRTIYTKTTSFLNEFAISKYDTTQALRIKGPLLMSLRDPANEVPYTESISYPILERLQFKDQDDDKNSPDGGENDATSATGGVN